jgi:hypothetical protein
MDTGKMSGPIPGILAILGSISPPVRGADPSKQTLGL